MPWKHAATVTDGQPFLLDGVNVWTVEWTRMREQFAVVNDPLYGQRYEFAVYSITASSGTVVFAAGEFSNCVWGFYVPA